MNIVIAYLAGMLTWWWFGRVTWRYAMRASRGSVGGEARANLLKGMSHDDLKNLRRAMEDEVQRRGMT